MDLPDSVTGRLSKKAPLIATGIILIAAFLRFYALTKQPLWYDELISVTVAMYEGGLEGIWKVRFYPHPPLFVVLLHFLFKGFPPSEFTARLLPLFSSLVAFPLFYRYTADVANKRIALMGLLILAFSPFHIFFSQDARPYTMLFTLVVLTLWVLRKALQTNKGGWWVAHAVCLLLLLYLHFFNWCIVGSEALYMLLTWRRHRHSLVPFALSLLLLPLAIPPLLNLLRDSQAAGHILVLDAAPASISFSSTWMTLVAGETRYVSRAIRLSGVLAFGLLALVGGIWLWKYRPTLLVLISSLLIVPFAFVFVFLKAAGHIVPPYQEKQFIIILPFALILVASGVESLCRVPKSHWPRIAGRIVAGTLLAILFAGNMIAIKRYFTSFEKNLDIRVIEYLESRVEPGDIVICNSPSIPTNIHFHWDANIPIEFISWPRYSEGEWRFSEELLALPEDPVQWNMTLEDVLLRPRVWLISQNTYSFPQLTADLLALVPPSSSKKLGPFSIYLLVP